MRPIQWLKPEYFLVIRPIVANCDISYGGGQSDALEAERSNDESLNICIDHFHSALGRQFIPAPLSVEASVVPGSLGLIPTASPAGVPNGKIECIGIYEPIHGSAPDIVGKGIVNPVAAMLPVAMMLQYSFNLQNEAKAVEEAVKRAIEAEVTTCRYRQNLRSWEQGGRRAW